MAARVQFGEMSREQVREIASETTLIIPVAAVEQHGPDLPLTTDVLACQTIAMDAATLASQDISITVAPIIAYGYSPHHLPYPGVMSLRMETLLSVLRDLGECAFASGFRRVFYLNGHGGNDELIRMAAREISNRHPMLAGAASYWTMAMPALRRLEEAKWLAIPGHAGDFETALIMTISDVLIDSDHAALHKGPAPTDPYPQAVPLFTQMDHSMERIDGYTERSTAPSATLGQILLTAIEQEVARGLVQFHRSWSPRASTEGARVS